MMDLALDLERGARRKYCHLVRGCRDDMWVRFCSERREIASRVSQVTASVCSVFGLNGYLFVCLGRADGRMGG